MLLVKKLSPWKLIPWCRYFEIVLHGVVPPASNEEGVLASWDASVLSFRIAKLSLYFDCYKEYFKLITKLN